MFDRAFKFILSILSFKSKKHHSQFHLVTLVLNELETFQLLEHEYTANLKSRSCTRVQRGTETGLTIWAHIDEVFGGSCCHRSVPVLS